MTDPYDARIADLERRVSGGVIVGTVSQVDYKMGRYRVKSGLIETDWLPMASARAGETKTYSGFNVGEQVVVAAPSGDMSQGVILSAVSTGETQASDKGNLHRTVYPDGTTVEYDHDAKTYKMDVASGGGFQLNIGGGASIVAAGGQVTMKAPGGMVIEAASLEITSPVLTNNGVDVGFQHKHIDTTPGAGVSGPPEP